MKYALLAMVAFFVLGAYVALTNESSDTSPTNTSLTTIEIADEPEERRRGLSGRESIPDDYGMLFVFPEDGIYGFWMKDMKASIDVVWLSSEKTIVGIDHTVSPDSYPEMYYPPTPVRYVLETRAGLSKERGWGIGTALAIP